VQLKSEMKAAVVVMRILLDLYSKIFSKKKSSKKLPLSLQVAVDFIEKNKATEKENFFFVMVPHTAELDMLLNSCEHQGTSLQQADPYVVGEILKMSLKKLKRKPFNLERYEPIKAFNELEKDEERIVFIQVTVKTLKKRDYEILRMVLNILLQVKNKHSSNAVAEQVQNKLEEMFAPLLIDHRWLNHKQPPVVKLEKAFVI